MDGTGARGYASWLAAVTNIAVSIACSCITLVFVELPGIAVGRQIVGQWRGIVLKSKRQTEFEP